MNAEIRTAIEKYANEAADLFRTRLKTALLTPLSLHAVPLPTIEGRFDWSTAETKKRKPGLKSNGLPIQLCPVPGCKNRAAPVFGMVCGDHRHIKKATIAKYRAARKAKKAA